MVRQRFSEKGNTENSAPNIGVTGRHSRNLLLLLIRQSGKSRTHRHLAIRPMRRSEKEIS